jgi:hypothetical protein
MEGREETPGCNPDPPDLTATLDLLRHLLAVELERLEVARQIERERRIVFPETTIIIRDIQKLRAAIDAHERGDQSEEQDDENADVDPLDALTRDLGN